jgi:hypothetical protein
LPTRNFLASTRPAATRAANRNGGALTKAHADRLAANAPGTRTIRRADEKSNVIVSPQIKIALYAIIMVAQFDSPQ